MKNTELLPKPFRRLALFWDKDSFIRVGGRLGDTDDISFVATFSIRQLYSITNWTYSQRTYALWIKYNSTFIETKIQDLISPYRDWISSFEEFKIFSKHTHLIKVNYKISQLKCFPMLSWTMLVRSLYDLVVGTVLQKHWKLTYSYFVALATVLHISKYLASYLNSDCHSSHQQMNCRTRSVQISSL